jgi:hypothetical protein
MRDTPDTRPARNAARALQRYGWHVCVALWLEHVNTGEGARTLGFYRGMTTNQADAAIDAGRWLATVAAKV